MSDVHVEDTNKMHEVQEEDKKVLFRERVWVEQQKRELEILRAQLEQQKKDFRIEQDMTVDRNRSLQRQLEQEKKLFDMKWKILEEECRRLAEDKHRMEQERMEYQAAKKQRQGSQQYELFFIGVNNQKTLKKRYKDLIKIFHPDNIAGDKAALQEINREYDILKQQL